MNPNPLLKRLGLTNSDRAVIIHVDDVGMCQASLAAYADLVDFGLISSGSVMVPCSWFPAVVAYYRSHPTIDLGVHLTVNCEWDVYRWGPIAVGGQTSGLVDAEGYFHRSPEATQHHATPETVYSETEAQLNRALSAGIDVTHIDTHMGTVVRSKFIPGYLQLAIQHQLPPLIIRMDASGYQQMGMDQAGAEQAAMTVQELEAQHVPMVDALQMLPLDQPENRVEQVKRMLDSIPAGITHFIIHAAKDSPELRAIAPDWPSRVADYEVFSSDALRDYVRHSGIQVIGYRAIRDCWRSG